MIKVRSTSTTPRRCRACLTVASSPATSLSYVDLGEGLPSILNGADTYLQSFNECTKLDLTNEQIAKQPQFGYLCGLCKEELIQACHFINKARLSDEILKQHETDDLLLFKTDVEECLENMEDFEKDIHFEEVEFIESQDDPSEGEKVQTCASSLELEEDSKVQLVKEDSKEVGEGVSLPTEFLVTDTESLNSEETENMEQRVPLKGDITSSFAVQLADSESDDMDDRKHFFEFRCELCIEKYDFQRDLMEHYERDHDESTLNFPCNICDRRFVTKNTLRIHKRQIHLHCEYLDCEECGRTVLKTFYKVHMTRHRKKKKFLCSKCPNTFTSKYTLKKHMILHSSARNRNIVCTDCGRSFYSAENLELHRVVHQDPEERAIYSCTLCDKTFLRQSNLKLHLQMHRGETMDCPHCGKQFVRSKDLEIHIRFHTGNFPYSCGVCSRRFAIKGHLKAHEKRHAGVRYKCESCEKEFVNLSGLRQHSYEHSGMPLTCKVCQRGFPTRFKMRRHIRSVHQNLFGAGYTDSLAEQYIVHHEVLRLESKTEYLLEEEESVDGDNTQLRIESDV